MSNAETYNTCSPFIRRYINAMVDTRCDKQTSAKRAGYTGTSIAMKSSNLWRRPWIRLEIEQRINDRYESNDASIIAGLADIVGGDIADYDALYRGALPSELRDTGVNTKLIKSLQVETRGEGDNATHKVKFELYDRKAALDTLARIRGLDKGESNTGNADVITGLIELAKSDRQARREALSNRPALKVEGA